MSTLLLCVIYVAFIGLGVPDSLFGAAWPAIYTDLSLPVSYAPFVSVTSSACLVACSLFSARIIHALGTARITLFSTLLSACSLLGYAFSEHFIFLVLLAAPFGFAGGAIDAALNTYVALHYRAMHMSFLHCFYGVGVSLSPYVMSLALKRSGSWQAGYRTAALLQFSIALLILVTLPLWRRVGHVTAVAEEEHPTQALSIRQTLRLPGLKAVCLIFLGSCALETVCGNWGSTYLVNSKGLSVDRAAEIITLYYVGMALGRFLSGLLLGKMKPLKIVLLGQGLVAVALLLLFLPLSGLLAGVALFLIGLGNGPVFPNMVYLTPENYGREAAQSAMGVQLASAYIGILCFPSLFAYPVRVFGTDAFPPYLAAMGAIMLIATAAWILRRGSTKR